MALTFTKRLEMSVGPKKMSMYDVTHDGSETSIDASDIGLHYVDSAMVCGGTTADYADLTTTYGASLAVTALSASAVTVLWAIGW
jgi:hypothetical protein